VFTITAWGLLGAYALVIWMSLRSVPGTRARYVANTLRVLLHVCLLGFELASAIRELVFQERDWIVRAAIHMLLSAFWMWILRTDDTDNWFRRTGAKLRQRWREFVGRRRAAVAGSPA